MSDLKKKGLGRGLSALFGDSQNNDNKKTELNTVGNQKSALIGNLERNQFQPRFIFDEEKLNQLSESIKKNGLIQPIAVRENKADPQKYEIIAGERRWLAAQKAGFHEVPIVVLDLSDNEALEVAIVENIQREDLNSIEEARGYQRLSKEFMYDQDKIAKMMSKSRSHISNTLRLLTLPQDVISMIESNEISAGQARPLIGMSDPSSIAEQIVSKKMSARTVEQLVKNKKNKSLHNKKIDANTYDIQRAIEEVLGLRVTITNSRKNSGKIIVEYKNLEQFEFVSNLLKQR
jgi:ParB family chromosome partitioning protein